MAISAWPADTRPSPTLMRRVLPCPIKNRVRFGLKKKNSKRVQVFTKTQPEPGLGLTHLKLKLPKKPYIYIYIYKLIKPYLSFHSSIQPPHPYPLISLTLLTLTHPEALSPSAITWSHRRPSSAITTGLKLFHHWPSLDLTVSPLALSPQISSSITAEPEVPHRFVSHGHCFSLSLIFIF